MRDFQILLNDKSFYSLKFLIAKLLLICVVFATGCDSKEQSIKTTEVEMVIHLNANGNPIDRSVAYENGVGELYYIEELRFYLSNIKLFNVDNEMVFQEKDSYHLIEAGDEGVFRFKLQNVPEGEYYGIKYAVGVDPIANSSTDKVGDLDVSNGMAWDWNTGYRFISSKGRFFTSGNGGQRGWVVHLGTDENYTEFENSFEEVNNTSLFISSRNRTALSFEVEVQELFRNPNKISLSDKSSWMYGPDVHVMAENLNRGFIKLKEVQITN